ncbi:MAG: hypothetical protein ACTSWW_12275 [Promethearchaeota archaeon]
MKINTESLIIRLKNGYDTLILPSLTQDQQEVINPIVPPTSGIRMKILDPIDGKGSYEMFAWRQYMFFRVFKAVSEVAKKKLGKSQPGLLLVSDDRPTANFLLEYCAKIFAFDGYKIHFQKAVDPVSQQEARKAPYYSRMGTPHGSASVALCDEIDVVVVITASHNSLIWNGIKFYIELPMPISGRIMQTVSTQALSYTEIPLLSDFSVLYLDADRKNNDYIIDVVSRVLDLSPLHQKKILFWPYMGRAPEFIDLFHRVGVEVVLIEKEMDPPNPTVFIDHDLIERKLIEENARIAILLDADRDRLVFIVRTLETNTFHTLLPNTLYTAMHNILASEFHKKIINVRTIPSDPRGDQSACLTILTGVGFKHLGMIIYGALKIPIELQKFETGILYTRDPALAQNRKISTLLEIQQLFTQSSIKGTDLLMMLWEESGGHTVNLVNIEESETDGLIHFSTPLLAIGDKYPAPALLILSALIEQGYCLTDWIDQDIVGTRTMLDATDARKVKIVESFATMKGESFAVGDEVYSVDTFEQVNGDVAIIHLHNPHTTIYFRPSGTGPGVRIYIFGRKSTVEHELQAIKQKLDDMF